MAQGPPTTLGNSPGQREPQGQTATGWEWVPCLQGDRKNNPCLKGRLLPGCYFYSLSSSHFNFYWWLAWEAKALGLPDFTMWLLLRALLAPSLGFTAQAVGRFLTRYHPSLSFLHPALCLPPLTPHFQGSLCLPVTSGALSLLHWVPFLPLCTS